MSDHLLAAAQAGEIVSLAAELDRAKNDSDFWHTMYDQSQKTITELKAQLISQEGDGHVSAEL